MSRKVTTVLFAVMLSLVSASAVRAAPIRLRFANFPAAATFPCIAMEQWAKDVTERTNGALAVETFPGGTLLEAKNMVRGVMRGQADIGCISLAYHPGAYPFLSVFELPLGFSSAEAASGVMWDIYTKHQPKEVSRVKVIALYSSAPSQIMSAKPVTKPGDVKGLVLRCSGILADVAATLGASPVSMPQSDTPEALQKGVVQGVFSSFDVLKDYNFAESCRHGLAVDMPVYPFMVFMNLKKWDSLPANVQKAIMDLAPEHSVWTGRYVDAHGREAVKWSEETHGFTLTELDGVQKKALLEAARPVMDQWVKKASDKGVDAPALLDEVLRARENAEKRAGG